MNSEIKRLVEEHLDNILKPFGEFEVLLFYRVVAEKLVKLLKGKELAAKNWIPKGVPYLIKRGSKLEPLYVQDFIKAITPEFLEIRGDIKSLSDARSKLHGKQELIWRYFLPRKLSDFFYATNQEGEGKPIERIFYDIDIGEGLDAKDAQKITRELVRVIREQENLEEIVGKHTLRVCWTGASFHVYLFLDEKKPHAFYDKYIRFSKDTPAETLTEQWIEKLKKRVNIPVIGGHEEVKGKINIDPSQTPSGKLCRIPFGSLHMSDARTVNGVSIPLELNQLHERNLVSRLRSYTPKKLVGDLDKLSSRLPKRFRV